MRSATLKLFAAVDELISVDTQGPTLMIILR